MLLEGQQIDRYRLLCLLGSGGMSDVYLAEDVQIGQQVVIKILRTRMSFAADGSMMGVLRLTVLTKEETQNSVIAKPSEERKIPSVEKLEKGKDSEERGIPIDAVVSPEAPPATYIYEQNSNVHIDRDASSEQVFAPMLSVVPPLPQEEKSLFAARRNGKQNEASPRKRPVLESMALLGFVLLIIVASITGTNIDKRHKAKQEAIKLTEIAYVQQSNAIGTVSAQATMDANATSTMVAQVTATVQAQVRATAAVVAANPYPAYLPGHGKLALYDSLRSSYYWNPYINKFFGGSCQFANNALDVQQSQINKFFSCVAYSLLDRNILSFSNFAFEVQMTILQGNCGGIVFREDVSSGKFYKFEVCQDRRYSFAKYVGYSGVGASLLPMPSVDNSAINAGVNQMNKLAVVVKGGRILLFINNQQVADIEDGDYAKGAILLLADSFNAVTNVAYREAKVWTL